MDDMCERDINLPIPNFPEANGFASNPTQYSDFSKNVNKNRKRRRQLNFLNNNNNQYLNSRASVVDLTDNNGQFVNRRIPIIDLTDEDVMDITGQIQCIDLTNEYSSSNNHLIRHFELKRKLDSSSNSHSDCRFELTSNDDSLGATHPKRHLDLTRNGNSSINTHRNHHFEPKSNGNSSSNSHLIKPLELPENNDYLSSSQSKRHLDPARNGKSSNNSRRNHHFELTSKGNYSSSSHLINHFELTRNDDSSSNSHSSHPFELQENNDSLSVSHPKRHLDLTRNGNSSNNSHRNHPFELTSNGNSSSNSDLINRFELPKLNYSSSNSHPSHHFEVPVNNDSSSNIHPNHTFELNRNGRDTDHSSERYNFANQDSQIFIPNVPVRDLNCFNEEITNYRMSDMKHNNGQHITHQLQFTDLADVKQQCNANGSIPSATLGYDISQSIEQNIPPIHLTSEENYPNYSQPIFDLATDNVVHNVEGLNTTDKCTHPSDAIQNDTVVREPIDIAGMYDSEVSSCNNLLTNCSIRATEINPRIPFETPRCDGTELNILKYNETPKMHFMEISSILQQQCKKEIISKNSHPQAKCYQPTDLRPGKHVKISEMNTFDLLKPAIRPILFRHSLGRSTVNTSKNVPIGSTEVSKSRSPTMTVSSTLRQKKAKSSGSIPKQIHPNSLISFRSQLQEKPHFRLELLKNFV